MSETYALMFEVSKSEQSEIMEALNTVELPDQSFNRMLIKTWVRRTREGKPLSDVAVRHSFRLLAVYRSQLPETFEKFKESEQIQPYL